MSLIVAQTKDVQKRLTAHGIAFYTSGQLFLEEYLTLAVVGKAGEPNSSMRQVERILMWVYLQVSERFIWMEIPDSVQLRPLLL